MPWRSKDFLSEPFWRTGPDKRASIKTFEISMASGCRMRKNVLTPPGVCDRGTTNLLQATRRSGMAHEVLTAHRRILSRRCLFSQNLDFVECGNRTFSSKIRAFRCSGAFPSRLGRRVGSGSDRRPARDRDDPLPAGALFHLGIQFAVINFFDRDGCAIPGSERD